MRILIVDDEPAMHESYRRSFAPAQSAEGDALDAMAADLFGDDDAAPVEERPDFALTHAMQGLDGVAAVEKALAAGEPFAVAFIDVRMPPGIDGKETARRIRALDPEINLVIVTGYSDFSPLEISRAAGPADKIFYIAKPFEVAEVTQMAGALTHRWQVDRELAAARVALAAQVVQLKEQGAELAANESKALHLATHDSLTDAPNRLAFVRSLAERAREGRGFATAMLDLDRFKLVNDTLGHLAGDDLLRQVYGVLQHRLPEGAMIARLGGDEFGLLFESAGEDASVMACEMAIRDVSAGFTIFGHSVSCGASVGLVFCGDGACGDPGDVLRRADLALNDAKHSGRGVVRVFDESMDDSIRFRRRIEGGLAQSIERGELSLAYQPIVDGGTLEISGFEALLRWNTEEFGPVSPAMFIPIAEESNLIHELGDWVLDQALAVLAEWPGQYVSVNFSPRQFRRQNFVAHVVERVQRAGVEPNRGADRDHRDGDLRRCRSRGRDTLPAAPDGLSHRPGRFRHRLFVALQHPQVRTRLPEDRQELHRRHGPRARVGGDRPFDRPSRSCAGVGRGGGGRGDARPAAGVAHGRRQPHPGLLSVPSGQPGSRRDHGRRALHRRRPAGRCRR